MKQATNETPVSSPWTLTTGRIVTAGVLAAITIIMGVIPGLGFIPIPNITASATIEHVPTILGAVLEGPVVGMVTGLIFGLTSFLRSGVPLFKDPLVSVLPRILIGLTAWLAFAALYRLNRDVAAFVAGLVGAVTNTVFVLGIAIARGYFPLSLVPVIIPQAVAEAIVAAILTVLIARAVYIVRGRFVRAPDTKPRDELPY